jgi:hypothetical protein
MIAITPINAVLHFNNTIATIIKTNPTKTNSDFVVFIRLESFGSFKRSDFLERCDLVFSALTEKILKICIPAEKHKTRNIAVVFGFTMVPVTLKKEFTLLMYPEYCRMHIKASIVPIRSSGR